jgi:hypothetical protein
MRQRTCATSLTRGNDNTDPFERPPAFRPERARGVRHVAIADRRGGRVHKDVRRDACPRLGTRPVSSQQWGRSRQLYMGGVSPAPKATSRPKHRNPRAPEGRSRLRNWQHPAVGGRPRSLARCGTE